MIFVNVSNVACGFYGLRMVDVPMFLCLRRTATAFVIAMEFCLLGKAPNGSAVISVFLICAGAVLAGVDTLQSNLTGYFWIFLNNVLTAAYLSMVRRGSVQRAGTACFWLL